MGALNNVFLIDMLTALKRSKFYFYKIVAHNIMHALQNQMVVKEMMTLQYCHMHLLLFFKSKHKICNRLILECKHA